ncbi:N-glycosylase/DNA lyase [Candidatus Bathyarchaeota archaeon]|nr:N-glycosylase/DNA lyase [Candidatus Bathyarchaeota archaeon]
MSSNSSSAQSTIARAEEDVRALQSLYRERREEIQKRLSEFRQVMTWTDEEVFGELAFCLLTPQSSAKICWDAIIRLKQQSLLLKGSPADLEPHLSQVRFGETKARYIVEARNMFTKDGSIQLKPQIQSFYNPFELREWLVENVKGLGYKEASHFLRNIGLGEEFAILDRHILRNLANLGVIPEIPPSITKKRYLEIEEKSRRFAAEIGIPMADLDLLFWSKETGWIFK